MSILSKWLIFRQKLCPETARDLKLVWFLNNGFSARARREFCPELLQACLQFGYLQWPHALRRHVRRKDIVDFGCGRSLHGIGFLLMGARSYTGLDAIVDLDLDAFKDTAIDRVNNMKPIGWTPRRIAERVPRIQYLRSAIEDVTPDRQWDVLVMHNVTEHLMQIERVFEHLPKHIRPDGKLVFRHPNHYAWNGHHMLPRYLSDIREDDPEQKRYIDWGHLTFDPTWPDTILKRQNRIRLHELRALVEKHFVIEKWAPRESTEKEGGKRLTPEILARHPEFTREELLTQSVLIVARPKRG